MNKSCFEDEINRNGKLLYVCVGDSMMPLIRQNRDVVMIEKVQRKLKKYEVPLYKRDNGQYVLHRIMKVRKDDYVTCGDNRYHKEYGITDDQIIGVLTGVSRNGKMISVSDWSYLLYVFLWCDFYPIRVLVLKGRAVVRRLRRMRDEKKKRC